MTAVARAALRLGTPDAISIPVVVVTAVSATIGNLVSNPELPLDVRLLTLSLGHAALWIPLVIARVILLREAGRPRPGLVLGAALTGLVLRAIVIGTSLSTLVGADATKWVDRIAGGLLNVGITVVAAAWLVATVRERRRQVTRLRAAEAELSRLIARERESLATRNDAIAAEIADTLTAELERVTPPSGAVSSEALAALAERTVRPLSHELESSALIMVDDAGVVPTRAARWREVIASTPPTAPLAPGITSALLALELGALAIAYPAQSPIFLVAAVTVSALLFLANRLLAPLLRGRGTLAFALGVLAASTTAGAIAAIMLVIGLGDDPKTGAVAIGIMIFTIVFSVSATVVRAVSRDRQRMVRELEQSSDRLARQLVRWRLTQWFQHQSVARALHGPVQTAVSAGALRLGAAMRGGAADAALLDQVRASILDALGVLRRPRATVTPLREALERIVTTWRGLCEVGIALDRDAELALADDDALRSCVIDMATEAVSNAVRHSAATETTIAIDLSAAASGTDVRLVVLSGRAPGELGHITPSTASPGLGTRQLRDCSLHWSLTATTSGHRLEAVLPLGQHDG